MIGVPMQGCGQEVCVRHSEIYSEEGYAPPVDHILMGRRRITDPTLPMGKEIGVGYHQWELCRRVGKSS